MLRHFLRIVLFLALPVGLLTSVMMVRAAPIKEGRELKYVLEPVFDKDSLRFRVDLSFKGDPSGTTRLVLPNEWAGQSDLYRAVRNIKVISPGATLSDTAEQYVKTLTHRPNQTLHIQYELQQDYEGSPRSENRYRPAVQNEYFHWLGHGGWMRPAWDNGETVLVSLQWKNLPKAWTIANSFGINQRRQRFRAMLGEFVHSIFVGGDFRVNSVVVGGKPVHTVVRGSWQFSDAVFADLVRRIVEAERTFWRDYNAPYYLVTLIPLDDPPKSTALGGDGLTNSFALFCARNAKIIDLYDLLAHEYFHNWNPGKLGQVKQPEQQIYWFSEGFTDYYAYLLLLRNGVISLDEYVQKYNNLIHEYYLSPVRTESNQRVIKDYWNDYGVQKLPYRRGLLLAANWNALIRTATDGKNSLDDVMLDLFRASQQRNPQLTAELINEHIRRYAGRDVLPDIRRYIDDGELIVPDKNALGSYVELGIAEVHLFELGFDLETLLNKKVIAGVKEDSAAYRAGLRDNQVVVRRSIYFGDTTKPVEITIREGIGERTIRYYPASRNTVGVPQYKLRPGITDKERTETLRWLGVASSSTN